VQTEIYRDVATRLLPVGDDELVGMIEELRGAPLLLGYRGQPPADIAAVVRAMQALQTVAATDPTIALAEINPLVAWSAGQGVVALDALIQRGS
jgi:acyl-CoA synthetase (NDP forming)